MSLPLKILLSSLGILLFILVVVLLYLFYSYKDFDPQDDFRVEMKDLSYFSKSYTESREKFLASLATFSESNVAMEVGNFRVPSKTDSSLYVDYAYLPGGDRERLLIIVSGIHGTEGFLGAALQNLFVKEYLGEEFLKNSSLLLIHGLNPYGFKYNRRVTENNVDLNRNAEVKDDLFSLDNPGYTRVMEHINPSQKADLSASFHRFFVFKALALIARYGMNTLRQAILQGQYQFPQGVYFGGKDFEAQIEFVHQLVKRVGAPYRKIMTLDLHTGYGTRGSMHPFINPVPEDIEQNIRKVFGDIPIDWGNKKAFYTVRGSFLEFIGKIHPQKEYIPMLFEFGTMNSQSTLGSLKSLHNTILENQGFHYGYANKADSLEVQRRFRNMFYPASDGWKSECMRDFRKVMDQSLERYLAF
jgi:hypothetical protein